MFILKPAQGYFGDGDAKISYGRCWLIISFYMLLYPI